MGKIRVIQYGVGPIGAGMVRLMLTKPAVQIVGAIDVDPKKVGKDLGMVAGAEREIGVKISSDAKAVLRSGADVVVHTTLSHLKSVADQLTDCLSAGLHVVSTCEELSYPFRKHPELSKQLDAVAREAQSRAARHRRQSRLRARQADPDAGRRLPERHARPAVIAS